VVQVKVYYADTDAGGVVYYANYLRWFEMGRCEWIGQFGMSVEQFAADGVLFAVARVEIDYLMSARLGDGVKIETAVERVRRVRFVLNQRAVRATDGEILAAAQLTMACISPQGKLLALPDALRTALLHQCE